MPVIGRATGWAKTTSNLGAAAAVWVVAGLAGGAAAVWLTVVFMTGPDQDPHTSPYRAHRECSNFDKGPFNATGYEPQPEPINHDMRYPDGLSTVGCSQAYSVENQPGTVAYARGYLKIHKSDPAAQLEQQLREHTNPMGVNGTVVPVSGLAGRAFLMTTRGGMDSKQVLVIQDGWTVYETSWTENHLPANRKKPSAAQITEMLKDL